MTKDGNEFWPDGIRLVVSISMQFEAGGQPLKGTDSPFPAVDLPDSVASDAAANTWFAYGYREGIPRMLDLWDRLTYDRRGRSASPRTRPRNRGAWSRSIGSRPALELPIRNGSRRRKAISDSSPRYGRSGYRPAANRL